MSEPGDDDAIDAVITWVDGDDPAHRAKLDRYLATLGRRPQAAAPTRFRAVGEIDYCIAGLLRFAPFVRRIHVVTDAQTPALLSAFNAGPAAPPLDKVRVVDHRAIFAGHEDCLPTFNSLAIETMLHRVPGLARQFIYLNDDFIVIKPVAPQLWFDRGQLVLRGRWRSDPQRRIDRRLRAAVARWRGAAEDAPRAGHVRSQALAAHMAGFGERLFELAHEPHPMNRQSLEAFYAANPDALRRNASCRLRDARQFVPQSLAAHLALRDGQARIEAADRLLYLKPASLSAPQVQRALDTAERDERIVFACIQSLDLAPPPVCDIVVAWLERVVGRLANGAGRVAP